MNVVSIVTVTGTLVGIVAGVLAIYRYYRPAAKAEIVNPTHQSENAGRHLTVSASIPRRRRRTVYWIAVQPDDCRANGIWWPQNRPLAFQKGGSASLGRVRLGREGRDGTPDVGKTLTVGLFEVREDAQGTFSEFADRDDPMGLPAECKLLHSVEVRRVRY
jgi:hypothetical protein